jgi:hypothetical protein
MRARLNMVACPRTWTSNLYHYCLQLFSHIDTRNQARTKTTTVIIGSYFDPYDASVDYYWIMWVIWAIICTPWKWPLNGHSGPTVMQPVTADNFNVPPIGMLKQLDASPNIRDSELRNWVAKYRKYNT